MIALNGEAVCAGISFGKILVFPKRENNMPVYHIENANEEVDRFEAARKKAISELDDLYEKAKREIGYTNAMIFLIHEVMLDDSDYYEPIESIIREQMVNAETAVDQVSRRIINSFEAMEDAYMRSRGADIRDISNRIQRILAGEEAAALSSDEPVIIIAGDIAPSETVSCNRENILAFVTENGSSDSHTSILARNLNIVSVVGAKNALNSAYNCKNAIVDGFTGAVYIDPDNETIDMMLQKKTKYEQIPDPVSA